MYNEKSIREYYQTVYGRQPTDEELKAALRHPADQEKSNTNVSAADLTANRRQQRNKASTGDVVEQHASKTNDRNGKNVVVPPTPTQNNHDAKARVGVTAFTHEHLVGMLAAIQANPLLIVCLWLVVTLFPFIRWYVLIVALIALIFVPLMTSNFALPWEQKISSYLQTRRHLLSDSLQGLKNSGQHFDRAKVRKASAQMKPNLQMTSGKTSHFHFNKEFWLGLIAGIGGFWLYKTGENEAGDVLSQIGSVAQNGELNDGGYLYIIGALLAGVGVLATIGGLLKALVHHPHGGGGLKVFSVLIALIAAVIAISVYANPVDSGMQAVNAAYQSGMSFDDISNIYQLIKFIPYGVAILYIAGILVNLTRQQQEL